MILNHQNQSEAITVSRSQARAVPVADSKLLCRVLGRWRLYLDARDQSIMPSIAMDGIWQPHITELVCDLVKPQMTCCDVGACFGYYSLLMSHLVGRDGKVHCFEPHHRLFLMMKHSLEQNMFCPRAIPHPQAAGDGNAKGVLLRHRTRFDFGTLSEKAKASFGKGDPLDVDIVRLDSTLSHPPDFCMIDSTGYEPQIVAGMSGLLNAQRKVTIILRYTPLWYADPVAFSNLLFDQGFSVKRIQDDGNLEFIGSPEHLHRKMQAHLLLTR